MRNIRLIARLDIKGPNLIKGIHLEGLRVVGDPRNFALKYYREGADEILFMDSVASLYGRNNLHDIVEYTAHHLFIPCAVGGGIRSLEDAQKLFHSGADKIALNTAAVANPQLIEKLAKRYGSQAIILSIEAKKIGPQKWEVLTENGREKTGKDVVEWAQVGAAYGAGEILLTSVDQEGTMKGLDLELIAAVEEVVTIPIIASGGIGQREHIVAAATKTHCDAFAMAKILHYNHDHIPDIRNFVRQHHLPVRTHVPHEQSHHSR